MRLEAPFGWFAAAMLYHVESSGLFLLPLLSNMDCSSTVVLGNFRLGLDKKEGFCYNEKCWRANIAQSVEQRFRKPQVKGSSPFIGSTFGV